MERKVRQRLRTALVERDPWVIDDQWGPSAVEAGECDRCLGEARLAMTCGPAVWEFLGWRCVAELGELAWCAGHAPDALTAAAWKGADKFCQLASERGH
jgi:hypothetical protein